MRTGPNRGERMITKSVQKKSLAARVHTRKERASQTGHHTPMWWEHETKKKQAVRCSSCGAVFLKGHWHTVQGMRRSYVRTLVSATCPACAAEKSGKKGRGWGGAVHVRGLGSADHGAVLAAIHAFGQRARRRDPEDRILSIVTTRDTIAVQTFQNQTAVRLAKKLDSAFKGGLLKIVYSSDDMPIRIVWTFPKRT